EGRRHASAVRFLLDSAFDTIPLLVAPGHLRIAVCHLPTPVSLSGPSKTFNREQKLVGISNQRCVEQARQPRRGQWLAHPNRIEVKAHQQVRHRYAAHGEALESVKPEPVWMRGEELRCEHERWYWVVLLAEG